VGFKMRPKPVSIKWRRFKKAKSKNSINISNVKNQLKWKAVC